MCIFFKDVCIYMCVCVCMCAYILHMYCTQPYLPIEVYCIHLVFRKLYCQELSIVSFIIYMLISCGFSAWFRTYLL